MLTFKEFLLEAINPEDNTHVATGGELHTLGHIKEHIAAAHKAAGNHAEAAKFSKEAKEHHVAAESELAKVHPDAAKDTRDRAKVVAKSVLDLHAKRHNEENPKSDRDTALRNISAAHHTPLGISHITGKKSHQTEDTADIVLSTKNKVNGSNHHGISYKNNKSVTKSSNGAEQTDAALGTRHAEDIQTFKKHMAEKYPTKLGKNASIAARKNATKNDASVKADTRKFQEHTAENTHHAFEKLSHEDKKKHIKSAFRLNTTIPTMLAQGSGSGGSAKAHVTDDDAKKRDIIDNAHKITSKREGTVVKYYAHHKDGSVHPLGAQDHRFTHSGHSSFSLTGKV